MPIHPQIIDNLAHVGSNIVIDAAKASPQEISAVVNLWTQASGNVTIRNTGVLPPNVTLQIANTLRGRVTFEE